MAHTRQSRPDAGLGFEANALKTFEVVLFSLASGTSLSLLSIALEPREE
jgi:hypothetical protein